jgi:tRNA(fMet)-specific endonuclease VapC
LPPPHENEVAISVITVAELFFGAWRSRESLRSLDLCRQFCDSFEILPMTVRAAELSAERRATLETSGQRIGPYDVLIAGVALAESRVLVTHNTREFGRAQNLLVEDWVVE